MKKQFVVLFFCILTTFSSVAQEGMWMLTQLGQLDLAKKGLMIPLKEIYEPYKPCLASAIIMLDGHFSVGSVVGMQCAKGGFRPGAKTAKHPHATDSDSFAHLPPFSNTIAPLLPPKAALSEMA